MDVTGTIGTDWMKRISPQGKITDEFVRAWRDYLEDQLRISLGLSSDLTIGTRTRFTVPCDFTHTAIEIESFARKALDNFLNQNEAMPQDQD